MAWTSALAVLGIVAVIGLGVVTLLRRKRKGPVPVEPVAATPSEASNPEPIYSLAEAQALADEAERAGDCERAAQLLEGVGMLQRAIILYRCAGNIQKAAELELTTVALGRLASDAGSQFDDPTPSHVQLIDEHRSEVGSSENDFDYDDADDDVTQIHDGRPLDFLRMTAPSLPAPARSEPPRAASVRPAARSVAPRPLSSAPPPKRSERPRAPTAEQLLAMLGPSPAQDLGTIEIYYRLGLAYLAANQKSEARKAFLTVEDISPGYRDASSYLEQLPGEEEPVRPRNTSEAAPRKPRSGVQRGIVVEEPRAVIGRRFER